MTNDTDRPSVAVLAGGVSSEREVSLRSGRAVCEALRKMNWRAEFVDVTSLDIPELDRPFDVFFVALHGGFGEDGTLQALMQERDLAFTGCDAQTSRLCMDKAAAKEALAAARIPTAQHVLFCSKHSDKEYLAAARPLGGPVVIKPRAEGSSVGVSIASDEQGILDGIRKAVEYGDVLVEKFIAGRELYVGVLGATPLPIVEVCPMREFYDYEAKYGDSGTQYLTDAGLDDETYERVQEMGLAAFRALGCRDFARVDFLLDAGGRPYFIEANTVPGFTERSLLPMAAATAGIAFPVLCDKIATMARQRRQATRQRLEAIGK